MVLLNEYVKHTFPWACKIRRDTTKCPYKPDAMPLDLRFYKWSSAQVLSTTRYVSPILLAAYFALSNAYSICTLRYSNKVQPPKIWCRLGTTLSWATAVCYLAQALTYFPQGERLGRDGHIHALSQFLLWTTLSLILISTTSPPWHSYTTTWILAFFLELPTCALSLATSTGFGPDLVFQLLVTLLAALLSTLGFFLGYTQRAPTEDAEQRPLLSRSLSSESSRRSGYSTPNHNADSNIDYDSDSNDEEDDKALKTLQQRRLQSGGSWITYLKGFMVFWPYIWPGRNPRLIAYIIIIFANTLLERAVNVLHPRQLGIIVDRLTTERQIPWRDIFLWIFYGLLASDCTGLGAVNEILERRVSMWSYQQLTIASFDHVMSQSMSFHDEKDSGEIIKAVEQAGSLNSLLKTFVLRVAPGILDFVIAAWYVAYLLDAYAVLVLFAVAISFTFVTSYITAALSASRRESSARERDQSRVIYETMSNWSVVSYFNRRQHEKARLAGVVGRVVEADVRNNDLYVYLFGAQELCEWAGRLGISVIAAYRTALGLSPIGTFITVESYWDAITMPLYIMGHSYRNLSSDLIDSERLLQLFETPQAVQDIKGAEPLQFKAGRVEFDNVGFKYEERRNAVNDFRFVAEPGQTIALVGETGSGKSTTLKLLMRFYDVTSGRILVDGQDIRHVTQESLRELFGIVPQDPVLFNLSILENVRYGRLGATDEEVYDACRAAAIHDKISTFTHGYQTKVGERGIKLSGGEAQRLAIARVILKRPRIVLLDEATSAVDSQTEARIQSALRTLITGRTTFAIAHRLSTIMEADLVLVVDQGEIVQRGTHAELLEQGGRYKELWMKQVSSSSSSSNMLP